MQSHDSSTSVTLLDSTNSSQRQARALFEELEELERLFPGRNAVISTTKTLDRVDLTYKDIASRQHAIQIQLNPEDKSLKVLGCQVELPNEALEGFSVPIQSRAPWHAELIEPPPKRFKASSNNRRDRKNLPQLEELFRNTLGPSYTHQEEACGRTAILDCYQAFCSRVDQLQDFWNEMDDLDRMCCVVDPGVNSRATTRRKIRVDDQVTLHVAFNPLCPRQPPRSLQFTSFFNDSASPKLNTRMQESLAAGLWNKSKSVKDNIESCLKFSLPTQEPLAETRGDTSGQDNSLECGICYCTELPQEGEDEGKVEVPSITCENQPCSRHYHQTCLQDWLESLSTSRLIFFIITGECPYCKEPIACPIPE